MTSEDFKVGDRVRYKVGQESACLENGHRFGQIYTISSISRIYKQSVQFEGTPNDCMTKRLELVKEHRHHDLIVAWAKDPKNTVIQCLTADVWISLTCTPEWDELYEYRIKPKMHDVTRYNWVLRISSGGYFVSSSKYSFEEVTRKFPNDIICKIEESEETTQEEVVPFYQIV